MNWVKILVIETFAIKSLSNIVILLPFLISFPIIFLIFLGIILSFINISIKEHFHKFNIFLMLFPIYTTKKSTLYYIMKMLVYISYIVFPFIHFLHPKLSCTTSKEHVLKMTSELSLRKRR